MGEGNGPADMSGGEQPVDELRLARARRAERGMKDALKTIRDSSAEVDRLYAEHLELRRAFEEEGGNDGAA